MQSGRNCQDVGANKHGYSKLCNYVDFTKTQKGNGNRVLL